MAEPTNTSQTNAGSVSVPGSQVINEQYPAGDALPDRDLPGEGQLPRREEMKPGDHRPRKPKDKGRKG